MKKILLLAVLAAIAGCAAKPLPVELVLEEPRDFNAGIVKGACLSNDKLELYAPAHPDQGRRIYDCKTGK